MIHSIPKKVSDFLLEFSSRGESHCIAAAALWALLRILSRKDAKSRLKEFVEMGHASIAPELNFSNEARHYVLHPDTECWCILAITKDENIHVIDVFEKQEFSIIFENAKRRVTPPA